VAIVFMVLGIYLLFEKRYVLLLPLGFLFAWTYSLFITLLGMAVIWACVVAWSERRFEWRPVVWSLAGIIGGLVINPYFPKNLRLFFEHVSMKVAPAGFAVEVGQEWYPYDSWYFLGSCAVAFVAMIVGYAAYDWSDRRRAARPLFLMFFATTLMIACFAQRRWVEYWPPFAVLFAAFSLRPLLEGARAAVGRLPSELMEELQPYLDRHEPPGAVEGERRRDFWQEAEIAGAGILLGLAGYYVLKQLVYPPPDLPRVAAVLGLKVIAVIVVGIVGYAAYIIWRRSLLKAFAVLVAALLVVVINFNVRETRRSIAGDAPPDRYEASMAWLRENVPAGETIFSTDWDDFPKMFYYDTKHVYVSGLDPTYLLDRDRQLRREPRLSELYKKITLGEQDDPGPLIREKFGARYVFSDNEHDNFYAKAMESGWFEQVHIYTFERKDGRPLTREELDDLKRNAPPELNNWTIAGEGRVAVTGATRDFVCADINNLCDRFAVNKDIDSTVLRLRDQKGPAPEEAVPEEMGDDDDDEGTAEGGDEQPENQ
ncbi:MAG TPA: hypothetical protein VD861_17380, partial [Pyrinomonadaceae bacterium]|nr:hypothetical protein [Pyrinomonadaceae bacterium]